MKPPLVVVLGPTASGKSDLALDIAQQFGCEIVNCDSLQLYRYLDIGTAKVPPAERRGIPHHLVDIIDPDQVFTAGEYAHAARRVLGDITARGRLPVVVGGTGFYLRALLEGLFSGPAADRDLRVRLARRPERLHRLLTRLDSAAAARIHSNDTKKLIRALEVCLLSRRRISELQPRRERLDAYDVVKIGVAPPRAELHGRIDERCRLMFDRGLTAEVAAVVSRFGRDAKALEAIGYREALMLLEGRLSGAEALALAQLHTRQYAKRQMTWFRREADVVWFAAPGNLEETKQAAIRLVTERIKIFGEKTNHFRSEP
jgi:tRNA dimethylallyltransferase